MRVTLKDIANLVHVDIGTVSHVINGHPKAAKLRPETRERIMKAVRETGYTKNKLALAIKSGHSRIMALVSNNIGDDEFMGRIMSGLLEVLAANNYSLRVFSLRHDNHAEIVQEICAQRIEAVFFHAPGHEYFEDIQLEMQKNHLPCATIDISNRIYGFGVVSEDQPIMEELISYALDRGFVNFCGPMSIDSSWEFICRRSSGFISGIKRFADRIRKVWDLRDVDFASLPENTAIICTSDHQALKILEEAHWKRESFPSVYGISGFGDGLLAGGGMLPLTSINQNHQEMGKMAAAALVRQLADGDEKHFSSVQNETIKGRIIPRRSM
ncbi:MAG: LacI family DNA-binding transcriptional regulator [Lentisphaeria bacterium]|nr:LacI family DNA-binding transcriptional regulator [Lentisphaeria bacterium]